MIRAEGPNVESLSRQRTVVVTADDQQIKGPSMASLPSTHEIGDLHDRVGHLGRFLGLAFTLILLALAILNLNYLRVQDLKNAWNEAAAKSEGGAMSGLTARKYNAAHAPVMSHPVQNQLHRNVVQALRTGQYKAFASMLDNVTESVVRQGVTIFAPSDEALSDFLVKNTAGDVEPEDLVRFHIVSGIMPYSNLLRLKVGSRLTTDVSNVTIQVTNATAGSYQVDDAVIVEPDLYTAATIAVHGINGVFNTTKIFWWWIIPFRGGGTPEVGLAPGSQSPACKSTNIAVKGIPVFQFLVSSAVLFLIYLTADI